MASGYPSGFNTFVPSFEASGHLSVSYSRNPKDFPLNQWITLTPVNKSVGYYLQVTAEVAARVINSPSLNEFVWNDGADAPTGEWGLEAFNFQSYNTVRFTYPFRIGYKAEEQASWQILAMHSEFAAQDAMTARATRVISTALTTSNYASNHVATATAAGGGLLSAGSAANPYIKAAFNYAAQIIQKDTVGRVRPKDLCVVMSPSAADPLGRSQEISDYVKSSPYALAQVRGDAPNQNGQWGLPDQLFGYKVVVDDTVRVTSKKNATRATSYAFAGAGGTGESILMCARPGQLTGPAGGPSFSTVHMFAYEEMTVEQRDDPDNRRIMGRVVEDFDTQVVAPASGFVITHVLS
jgi:hypothetical protein